MTDNRPKSSHGPERVAFSFSDTPEQRKSEDVPGDSEALLHQHRLAKAIYHHNLDKEDDEFEFDMQQQVNQLQQEQMLERRRRRHQHGHHHIGDQGMDEKQFEKELRELDGRSKYKEKRSGRHKHIIREAHKRKRHRITKKRFMNHVDLDLVKAAMTTANLENSPLWQDGFDVNKLSLENFIRCKTDMLKMEVIVEALKEGLLDKPGAKVEQEAETPHPTEQMLQDFEKERAEKIQKLLDDENAVLKGKIETRRKSIALPRTSEVIRNAEKEAEEKKLEALEKEDAITNLVKSIRPPDSPDDEWSINESTTTGSYLSWRKLGHPKTVKGKAYKEKAIHWYDESHHLILRLLAALIILGYWMRYFLEAMDDAFYDVYSERLHVHNVWIVRKTRSQDKWEYLAIYLHEWFHFIFTLIAPVIVVQKSTSLGVLYGFSILIDAFIFMYKVGHDFVYDSQDLSWKKIGLYTAYAVFMSLLFVFFLVLHYVVDNPVKIAREFSHRKDRLLNRIIHAKGLGNFEQRMFAWDWMVHHSQLRALQKLYREYRTIKSVSGHYPVPDTDTVNFDLRKELRLFRLRHYFYDITMRGGWVQMEKYQDDALFGSGESSDEEPLDKKRPQWKQEPYRVIDSLNPTGEDDHGPAAQAQNQDPGGHESLVEESNNDPPRRDTVDSQQMEPMEEIHNSDLKVSVVVPKKSGREASFNKSQSSRIQKEKKTLASKESRQHDTHVNHDHGQPGTHHNPPETPEQAKNHKEIKKSKDSADS